jgi:hypothetical protein
VAVPVNGSDSHTLLGTLPGRNICALSLLPNYRVLLKRCSKYRTAVKGGGPLTHTHLTQKGRNSPDRMGLPNYHPPKEVPPSAMVLPRKGRHQIRHALPRTHSKKANTSLFW